MTHSPLSRRFPACLLVAAAAAGLVGCAEIPAEPPASAPAPHAHTGTSTSENAKQGDAVNVDGVAGHRPAKTALLSFRTLDDLKGTMNSGDTKGRILESYKTALKENPALHGKLILRVHIAPSGEVTECHVASSDLASPAFEANVMAIIRQMNFGAKEVQPVVVSWPLSFLPD